MLLQEELKTKAWGVFFFFFLITIALQELLLVSLYLPTLTSSVHSYQDLHTSGTTLPSLGGWSNGEPVCPRSSPQQMTARNWCIDILVLSLR